MKHQVSRAVGAIGAVSAFLLTASYAFAFNASTTDTIFQTFQGDVGATLENNLPYILAILAGLIGLGILIRYFKRHVGKK